LVKDSDVTAKLPKGYKMLRTKLAFLLSSALVVVPSYAQVTPSTTGETQVIETEAIVVTGSRIKRKDLESSSPMQTITLEELQREGISSPEQFVSYLTSNGTGSDNLASNSDVVAGQQRGNNGASSANLRGQGAASTLVLLNGRRVAAHGLNGGAVDVNQIPLVAVQRIEVLKDGASAIYGTDAIGGVINYILRKDFTGMNVQAFADKTQAGGGDIYRASAIAGFGKLADNGFNIMAAVNYSWNRELRGDQRDFVNTFQPDRGVVPDTRGSPFATIVPLAGTILPSAGTAPFLPGSTTVRASGGINVLDLPGQAGCNSIDGQGPYDEKLWDFAQAQFACAWDTGRAAVLQQPLKTLNILARGVAAFGDHQVALEVTGSRANSSKRFSNVQITPNTTTQNYSYPSTGAAYTQVFNALQSTFPSYFTEALRGQRISYRWRCIECGRREIETTTTTGRAFIGADGPISDSWDYSAGFSYAFSKSESTLGSGYYFRDGPTGLIAALNTGVINPFLFPGQNQSQAGLDLLKGASAEGTALYDGNYSVIQADASISGKLLTLPGGDIQMALGLDYRRERYRFDGSTETRIIIAAPFDNGNALPGGVVRNIKAAYMELLVPLTEQFELSLAGRIDDYTGFGTTKNPKIAFKYKPVQGMTFRGSFNKGFRVPSFNQIFNPLTAAPYTGRDIADPGKCVGGKPDSTKPGCEVIQPQIVNGGNPVLGPEKATQYSLGIVLQPIPQFNLTVDYWRIKRTGTIQLLTLQQLADNYSIFTDRYFRDAGGNLLAINQSWTNAGESLTEGLEFAARGNGALWDGRWTASFDGTMLLKKTSRVAPSVPFGTSEVGLFTYSGDLGLRWKHNITLGYGNGDWSGSLTQIYRGGYKDQVLPGVASGLVKPSNLQEKVKPYVIYNLSLSYEGIKGLKLTGGVKNLFDTDPPFAITYDTNTGAGSSWEPRVADPRGRSFTLLAEYKF
jgi:iron complex outermembrane recepter protein